MKRSLLEFFPVNANMFLLKIEIEANMNVEATFTTVLTVGIGHNVARQRTAVNNALGSTFDEFMAILESQDQVESNEHL